MKTLNATRSTFNPCMLRTRTRSLLGGHLNKAATCPDFSGKRHLNRPAKPEYQHPLRGLNLQTLNLNLNLNLHKRFFPNHFVSGIFMPCCPNKQGEKPFPMDHFNLCATCKQIPALAEACKQGLQAMRNADRQKIKCKDTRLLSGSIDLDKHLHRSHPQDPRWDYCLGYRDHVCFIEVHPANGGHMVKEVIAKKAWTHCWLKKEASVILEHEASKDAWVWIASGKIALGRGDRYSRQLAQKGIHGPRRQFDLS